MPITTRHERGYGEHDDDHEIINLKRTRQPVSAVELDLDSLWAAGFSTFSFLIYALARFATENPEAVATIYTFETPSMNRMYFHNGVFFGVVGDNTDDLLQIILSALSHQIGVPVDEIPEAIRNSTSKVEVWDSPDFIDVSRSSPVFHIEDGFAWKGYEAATWYTDTAWI